MGLTSELGILVIISIIVCFLYKHLKLREKLKGINSPRSFPIIGHATIMKPDPEGFMDQVMGMGALYSDPRMVLLWIGPRPAVMVYGAQLVEPILSSSRHLNKGFVYKLLEPWLGLSLLTSNVERWRPKRKILTPTFHYDILKDFIPVFNDHSRVLVKKLNEVPQGEVVEISSFITLAALDIICETSMGKCVNAQVAENNSYVEAIYTINDCVQNRFKNPVMWSDFFYRTFGEGIVHDKALATLHGFTHKVINERERELNEQGWKLEGRLAFLDLLLDMVHSGQMDRDDVQAEVDTFMFEGHDTTATALTWAIHLLSTDMRVQQKAQAEIDEILGANSEVGVEELSALKYVECCIKETLRLYPSVPVIMRELGVDQKIGGHVIPAGTHILLNQYLVHRDPAQWEDPERFDPDRLLPENSVGRHSFALIPFSAGSRNCIGQRFALMEMKTVLTWMLYNFTFESVERRGDVSSKMELILRPANGVHVRLIPRRSVIAK